MPSRQPQTIRAAAAPLPAAAATPPTEFRIFARGANVCPSAHGASGDGVYQFTARSAAAIMAAYDRDGVDMMIDLEHESVAPDAARPDSRDARGWYRLEVRSGELWATDVRWTPDGERRLRERAQRYISPVFEADPETREITGLVNCALVAMPATQGAPALVAAASRKVQPTAMVCARVATALSRALDRYCAANRTTRSAVLARILKSEIATVRAGKAGVDLDAAVASIRRALGMPATASVDEVCAQLDDLLATLRTPPPSPASETADPPALAAGDMRAAAARGPKAWAAARSQQRAQRRK